MLLMVFVTLYIIMAYIQVPNDLNIFFYHYIKMYVFLSIIIPIYVIGILKNR